MDVNNFEPIKLKELDKVSLMNRVDTKYWFNIELLPEIFNYIKKYYYALEIDNKKELDYSTTYYDTFRNHMFISHHNGKLNRYKIRKRTYLVSGINFLEIKFKNNKGRTIKSRINTENKRSLLNNAERDFINDNAPYNDLDLSPVLRNEFTRITLVNKNFKERCTIDLGLKFKKSSHLIELDNLCIVEIKTDSNSPSSPIAEKLKEMRIKTSGFSKYCVGRTLLEPDLKQNAFKSKLRQLDKITSLN